MIYIRGKTLLIQDVIYTLTTWWTNNWISYGRGGGRKREWDLICERPNLVLTKEFIEILYIHQITYNRI